MLELWQTITKKGGLVYQYGKPFLETYQLCVDHLNQEKKVLKKKVIYYVLVTP